MIDPMRKGRIAMTPLALPAVEDMPGDIGKRLLMGRIESAVWDCITRLADEGCFANGVYLGDNIVAAYEDATDAEIESVFGLPVKVFPIPADFVGAQAIDPLDDEPEAEARPR